MLLLSPPRLKFQSPTLGIALALCCYLITTKKATLCDLQMSSIELTTEDPDNLEATIKEESRGRKYLPFHKRKIYSSLPRFTNKPIFLDTLERTQIRPIFFDFGQFASNPLPF